jgi:hypothetical protein
MFSITKLQGATDHNITVQINGNGTFAPVPLNPTRLDVDMNQVSLRCPGYPPHVQMLPANNLFYAVLRRKGGLYVQSFE